MCDIEPYIKTSGSFFSYSLAKANTQLGCDMTNQLRQLKGGKKKRYRYSNGISYNVRKKLHKTRRTKTHLSRRFLQNSFSKKNRLTKTSRKKYKSGKESHGRQQRDST